MKRASAFVLIFSFLFLLLASGCNQSVDDMLDGYNGGFEKGYVIISDSEEEEESIYSPEEEGFREELMLRDEYFVFPESTLILAGPPQNVVSYTWAMYDPANDYSEVAVKTISGSNFNREYSIYISESGLEAGKTYKLVLTIKSTGGVWYTDSCSVVVFKHYDYDNST